MIFFDLLYFLFILLTLPLWGKYFFNKEYKKILKHRLSPNITTDKTNDVNSNKNGDPSKSKRIWIHAVSVGEVKSLKNLINELTSIYPHKHIVLSVTTPTGFDVAKNDYKDNSHITVILSPVDFSFTIKKFLKTINPDVLILNELEIWPNWISITHKRNIPILLINGRISETAFNRYKKFFFLFKPFFNKIDRFLVQADIYKQKFQQLNIPPDKIKICGNIKADEAINACDHTQSRQEVFDLLGLKDPETDANVKNTRTITIASSHLSDEKLIIPAVNQLKNNYRFIFVPRHLTRVPEIEKLAADNGVAFTTWSKNQGEKKQTDTLGSNLLIFDQMGYLFNVLKISDIVFMGGTLERKIGGHNLYEPAILGKPIIGGPCYNNFPAIGEELVHKKVYHVITDTESFVNSLNHLDSLDIDSMANTAKKIVTDKKGSIQCTINTIRQIVN